MLRGLALWSQRYAIVMKSIERNRYENPGRVALSPNLSAREVTMRPKRLGRRGSLRTLGPRTVDLMTSMEEGKPGVGPIGQSDI